jgi:hypothetical protein
MPAQAGIHQYAAASRLNMTVSGILGHPPEPVIGRRMRADPVAGDDTRAQLRADGPLRQP